MNVALLSDIHGNIHALDAVLSDISSADKIICLGDIVGYGPKPRQCVERIRSRCDISIQGNHEKALIEGTKFNSTTARFGLEHARKQLYGEHFDWISRLPEEQQHSNTYILHSHPDGSDKHVYPDSINQEFHPFFSNYDNIWYGHTHMPVEEEISETLVVNPGSVGQPRDTDPRASYAVVDTETNKVDLRRVEYPIESVISELEDNNFPDETKDRIINAR